MINVGTDIVQISNFKKKFEQNRWKFERDVFFEEEMSDDSPEHLAGIFAAKEAVIKAFDLAPGTWKSVEIKKNESGKPILVFGKSLTCDISISHAGDYAIATVVCNY